MKANDVPKYVLDKYGLTVTRQTVYNWIKRGLQNGELKLEVSYTADHRIDIDPERLARFLCTAGF